MGSEGKRKTRSLTVILSVIIAIITAVVFSVFVFVVRSTVVTLTEDSYVNQLLNINKGIEQQLAYFLETQLNNARFLAKDSTIISAMERGEYGRATLLLRNFYDEGKIYEEVFISTAEEDSLIVSSGSGRATGLRWGNIPIYVQNSRRALKGESHIGNVAKSPATGKPVLLVTVPIRSADKVIGIVGLPVDVATYSVKLVKGITIGKTGYPYLTDMEGVTFAHPDAKNIFSLKLSEHEWGRQLMASKSGTAIRYQWQGQWKIQTFIRNATYGFISAATIFVDDFMAEIRRKDMILFPIAALLIAVSCFLVFLFMKKRLDPLRACEAVMGAMSEGHLTTRYNGVISNDEIGSIARALNATLDQFEKLISEIIVSSQNLAQAVGEIATGNQNLSQRTAEQASSLEEIASTIEEASATIKQNADTATEANSIADKSYRLANEGGRIVGEAVGAINEINESGRRIADIITMINEIAFQTNLLALNAAVEAARAGEQGRGFAVVAGEVRNLAQRSANAAREIGGLIKDSIDRVEKGTDLVNKSGAALTEIINSVQQVSQLITEIATAGQEQRQGMDQINIAITEMDSMTQQNAALVEQTASASEEMANQAQELLDSMGRFSISDETQSSVYSERHREIRLRTASIEHKER
jgi:methyl-accepting chemotaxis protein